MVYGIWVVSQELSLMSRAEAEVMKSQLVCCEVES